MLNCCGINLLFMLSDADLNGQQRNYFYLLITGNGLENFQV